MRISHAILVSTALFGGSLFAADECSCTCQGAVMRPAVSDARQDRSGYFIQNGKVMVVRDGQPQEITQEITFDNGMRLRQDGMFLMADGTQRRFEDNQWVSMDGRFSDRDQNRDFRAQNTRDGYFMQNGKVMTFRNGNLTEVQGEVRLDNGSRILADGTLVRGDGTRAAIGNQFVTVDGQLNVQTNRDNMGRNVSSDRFNNNDQQTRDSINAGHRENRDPRVENRNNANRDVLDADRTNPNRDQNIQNRSNEERERNERNQRDLNRTNENRDQNRTNESRELNRTNETRPTNPQNKGSEPTQAHGDRTQNAPSTEQVKPTQGRAENTQNATPQSNDRATQGRGDSKQDKKAEDQK